MAAIQMSIVDELLDEIEVSDAIQIDDFKKSSIWYMEVPNEGTYSFIVSEISREALTLPQRVALKRVARCEARTKMFRLEGPIKGKIMPLSVKCFTGYPVIHEVFAENSEQAELKLFPFIASTIEVVGNGVLISASPRERYETLENLTIDVNAVEETIALAESEDDRDTVRALKRAIRMGEKRLAAITKGKEKKNEEGQVSLF